MYPSSRFDEVDVSTDSVLRSSRLLVRSGLYIQFVSSRLSGPVEGLLRSVHSLFGFNSIL